MGVKVREKYPGSGVWWVFIYRDNRRVSRRVGSRAAARHVAKIIEGSLAAGGPLLPERRHPAPTLGEYFREFDRTYLRAAVRPSTREMYATGFARILRRIRFHDLRHTFATLLIQNGEPLAYVRDQLGHSSISMTVDTYTHWIPGSNREAMDRLPTAADATPQPKAARREK
ncbi:MAG: site-specific integrase [Acidobacteriota bacterium]